MDRIQQARDALLARQRELIELGIDRRSLEDSIVENRGQDLVDEASIVESVAGLEGMSRVEEHELAAIAGALARIGQGRYGVCETCQKPIGRRRLAAVPWTRICRRCLGRAEAG